EDGGPKNYIQDIQFSTKENKMALLIQRDNYIRKTDNGLGVQMVNLDWVMLPTSSPLHPSNGTTKEVKDEMLKHLTEIYWYQVCEQDLQNACLCMKWTSTLLLGTLPAIGLIIKGKGMFELVNFNNCSTFQQLYDQFNSEACNFVQIDRFRRFWISHSGQLRVIVAQPETTPTHHPEWPELLPTNHGNVTSLMAIRHLGSRIGYYINPVEKDVKTLDQFQKGAFKTAKKEPTVESISITKSAPTEILSGLHLFTCHHCDTPLLKPLQCSRCRSAFYCSKQCQQSHWTSHSPYCFSN
ncbi:hypothetical protein PROFUN_15000, partial [Planoprotostelium fungivorum]